MHLACGSDSSLASGITTHSAPRCSGNVQRRRNRFRTPHDEACSSTASMSSPASQEPGPPLSWSSRPMTMHQTSSPRQERWFQKKGEESSASYAKCYDQCRWFKHGNVRKPCRPCDDGKLPNALAPVSPEIVTFTRIIPAHMYLWSMTGYQVAPRLVLSGSETVDQASKPSTWHQAGGLQTVPLSQQPSICRLLRSVN